METIADALSTCAYCERPLVRGKSEIDHIIPDKHERGGCNCPENKVYACSGSDGCNETKGDKTHLEYFNYLDESGGFKDGGYTLAEQERFLSHCAYWEVMALRHLKQYGNRRPVYIEF
ncbi:MAG: HNH endonuclease signature motif containing protein [Chloroflexi bacterium]|nr:HNH endonuclease signature motif containing protein [Chloroflexota bacterium]